MKRMKRLGALLLALCMLFSLAPVASAANGTIKMTLNSNTMTVNGTSVKIDSDSAIKPQVKTVNGAGYTMLPLRAVVEAMGGTVAYDAASKVITLTYGGNTLKHTIGTKTATVNGVSKSMSIASYAANNRTYVHLRAIELLSSSVKVNWTASAPNDVTITYPQTTAGGAKTVNLTIKNACSTSYLQFTSLQLAPAGSTTYSGNLLDGTLILGGTRVLNMAIQPGKYDLKGTDINGNNFTWKNLDFTQVKASAVLNLTSGSMFTLSVDSALTGNASSNVTVYNNTGATITRIQAFQSTSTNPTEVYSGTLYSNSYTQIPLPYGTGNNVYYLTVTFSNGGQITYNYITVDGSHMTIALRGDGTFTYGGVTSGDGVYFVNRTGSGIKTLQMKLGKGGSWSTDLLDGTLKSGDYVLLDNVSTSELRNMTVYFRTTSSGSGKSVEVASSLKNSVVFYYGSSLSVKYNVDPSDVEYEEGLYIENDTGTDIEVLQVLLLDTVYNKYDEDDEEEELDSWDDDDFFEDGDVDGSSYDASKFYEEIEDLEDGDYDFIDEWDAEDLAGADLLFKVKFEGDPSYYYGKADLDKKGWDHNAYITIESYDDSDDSLELDDDYDFVEDEWEDDLETGLLFYNRTGDEVDIYVSTSTKLDKVNFKSEGDRVIKNLENKDWEQADDFDSYKKDVAGKTIYYYVASDSSSDSYGGSFFMKDSSSMTNACIILYGSSSSDKRDYDWGIDDSSDLETGVYLYNDSNYKITEILVGESDKKSDAESVYDGTIKSGKTKEIELDLDDISEETLYFWVTYEDDDGDEYTLKKYEVTIGEYDDDYEDNVMFRFTGSRVKVNYDVDLDDYSI